MYLKPEATKESAHTLLQQNIDDMLCWFSQVVESKQWDKLPTAYTQLANRIVPERFDSTIKWLLESVDTRVVPHQIYHRFYPKTFDQNSPSRSIEGWEWIEVQRQDGCIISLTREAEIFFSRQEHSCRIDNICYKRPTSVPHIRTTWSPEICTLHRMFRQARRMDAKWRVLHNLQMLNATGKDNTLRVKIDCSEINLVEQQMLEWAVNQAINRWNLALAKIVQFKLTLDAHLPDILISGHRTAVLSNRGGVCLESKYSPRIRNRTGRYMILVSMFTSENPNALLVHPFDLRHTIEHELGHTLGLDECGVGSSVMSGGAWGRSWPSPGIIERNAIQYNTQLCELYEKMLDTPSMNNLDAYLPPQKMNTASNINIVNKPPHCDVLPYFNGVPEWMRMIWNGECMLAFHNRDEALTLFFASYECSPASAEAAWRIGLTLQLAYRKADASIPYLLEALQNCCKPIGCGLLSQLNSAISRSYMIVSQSDKAIKHKRMAEVEAMHENICLNIANLKYCNPILKVTRMLQILYGILRLAVYHAKKHL